MSAFSSDPIHNINPVVEIDDDDRTIITSNCKHDVTMLEGKMAIRNNMAATAHLLFSTPTSQYLNAITIVTAQAIADTGATLIG